MEKRRSDDAGSGYGEARAMAGGRNLTRRGVDLCQKSFSLRNACCIFLPASSASNVVWGGRWMALMMLMMLTSGSDEASKRVLLAGL